MIYGSDVLFLREHVRIRYSRLGGCDGHLEFITFATTMPSLFRLIFADRTIRDHL